MADDSTSAASGNDATQRAPPQRHRRGLSYETVDLGPAVRPALLRPHSAASALLLLPDANARAAQATEPVSGGRRGAAASGAGGGAAGSVGAGGSSEPVLEGAPNDRRRGACLDIYALLWATRPDGQRLMLELELPDSVVFHSGKPAAWYFSAHRPAQRGRINMRYPRNLTKAAILERFASARNNRLTTPWLSERPLDVVAQFLSDKAPRAAFLNRAELERVLDGQADALPSDSGVLVRFMAPRTEQNEVIRVEWTRSFCVLERRINPFLIHDTRRPIGDRTVTYEEPLSRCETHLISDGVLSDKVRCASEAIAAHISAVARAAQGSSVEAAGTRGPEVSRLVFFAKHGTRNRLFLLWFDEIGFARPVAVPRALSRVEQPQPVRVAQNQQRSERLANSHALLLARHAYAADNGEPIAFADDEKGLTSQERVLENCHHCGALQRDASAPLYRVRLRTLIAAHYAAHGLNHIQRWLASPAEAKLSPAEAKETLPAAPPPASHRREKSSSSSKYLRDPLSLPPALAEAEEVLPAAAWRVRPDLAPARALELLRAHVVAEQRLRQHALRLREVREAALQRRQQLALERAVSRRQRGADAEGSGPSQQAPASPQEETQLPPPPPPPHSPESEAFLNSPAQVCDACLVSVRGTLRGSSAEAALLLEGPSPVELLDARLAELARRGARDLSGAERLFRAESEQRRVPHRSASPPSRLVEPRAGSRAAPTGPPRAKYEPLPATLRPYGAPRRVRVPV